MTRRNLLIAIALSLATLLPACNSSETSSEATPSAVEASPAPEDSLLDTPYAHLPEVPSFTVTSENVQDGEQFPTAQMGAMAAEKGSDSSPQLSWSGFPPETKSFAVSIFDQDAPTGSGFWHWAVANIPASVTSLSEGAGSEDGKGLPEGAVQLPNGTGKAAYIGPAPPQGTGTHRYFITVYALDTDKIDTTQIPSEAVFGFMVNGHALARASMVPVAAAPQ